MNQSDIELVRQPIPQMDKVYAVLDQIEADPEHWEQDSWSALQPACGTTFCFAGWACKLEGLEMAIEQRDFVRWENGYAESGELADGRDIMDTAYHLLGLTYSEANDLFLHTLSRGNEEGRFEDDQTRRERHLLNVKVEVARISARAKEQQAAFERVAKELIETVPELEDVLKPSYLCPESRELVMQYLGGRGGDN